MNAPDFARSGYRFIVTSGRHIRWYAQKPAYHVPEETAVTTDPTMRLLADHVPVTLLMDLLVPPNSREVLDSEGGEADWLAGLSATAA